MDRRHQVFVSSTYQDLVLERQHVIHALLELDCMPAGMELFPAAEEDAWSLIKGVIDDSDYYILILAGRYGSLGPDGRSYTEMEYDYAVSTGKPIIAFLHSDPDQLPSKQTETNSKNKKLLLQFSEKIKKKHCKFWNNPDDLGAKVSRSLVKLRKAHPSPGWVPGRFAADDNMLRRQESFRAKIAELERELERNRIAPPPGTENLAQGTDILRIRMTLSTPRGKEEIELRCMWDTIFAYVGPELIGECDEDKLEERIRLAFWHAVPDEIASKNSFEHDIIMPYITVDAVKVQLRALGLIEPGAKKRPISDKHTYWRMTPYGERYLLRARAIRRTAANPAAAEPPSPRAGETGTNTELQAPK